MVENTSVRLEPPSQGGGGETGRLIRGFDWSRTPLGPEANWPRSLSITLRIMLDSRYAMWLGWGPDFTFLYNDAYASMTLGRKHPWALGRSAREVWAEIWKDVGPRAEKVIATGEATWDEGLLLFLERNGFPEETYHTFSYSPIPADDGGVGGMLCVVTEDTERILSERRLRTLRELAARTTEEAKSVADACQSAARTLAENARDVPFSLIYLLDDDGAMAVLEGASGIALGSPAAATRVHLDAGEREDTGWPLQRALTSGPIEVDDLQARFGSLPGGPWPEPAQRALVMPMAKPGQSRPTGFLVAGTSPRLLFTEDYKGFLQLLAGHVATAVSNARAYEEERRRAEALATLDRAKTAFFSNVSHEFRTPLTLMLGPLEDLLSYRHTDLSPAVAGQLDMVNRNGLRLLRLVNSLLDFSRIEAGRARAVFQPTDLAAFTADLASNFRSACEQAGLKLHVACPTLDEPVFVDREMWEKIVLNLLSNAFKFTFEGGISVSLRAIDGHAELQVRDTGIGIADDDMPRLFERFHRIESARGRTHEGSGIGLALVQELVKLHGGTVVAESALGQGTQFTVTVPLGSAHLPADQIGNAGGSASAGSGATPFVEEALRWLPGDAAARASADQVPDPASSRASADAAGADRPRVLVADDNADMRQYIATLLSEHFQVETVADGEAALQSALARPPQLLLTDVMMPKLNGFGLLKALRADTRTRSLPIILLSARAGEESRIEGMEAGADDYLVKPFSARELLARVSAHLQMARLRAEATEAVRRSEERLRVTLASIGDAVITTDVQKRVTFLNGVAEELTRWTNAEAIGQPLETVFRIVNEHTRQTVENPAARALREGIVVGLANHTVLIGKDGSERPIDDSAAPVRDGNGKVFGSVLVFRDVSERRRIEKQIAEQGEAARKLAAIVDSSDDAIVSKSLDGTIRSWNRAAERMFGYTAEEAIGSAIIRLFPADRLDEEERIIARIRAGERVEHFDTVRLRKDGSAIPVSLTVSPVKDEQGRIVGASKIARDITERIESEASLRRTEARLLAELESTSRLHELSGRLLSATDLLAALQDVLDNAIRTCGADFGNIQLFNASANALEIAVQQGFQADFLDYFGTVRADKGSSCSQAMQKGGRVVIEDVRLDPSYAAHLAIAASAGYRAVASTPLVAHDGAVVGMLSVHFGEPHALPDSDGKLLDLYARHAADLVERLQLMDELRHVAAGLSEANRQKDEFLAILAHELRNPLAPIRHCLQILQRSPDAGARESARDVMERQLGQMVRLVDDLMDVSRITRGKVELRKERILLSTMIDSAIETSRPLIEQMRHELTVSLPGRRLELDADPTRLAQVFSNLLNNAAKYTDPGGDIRLTARVEGDAAVVSVRDNGVGIPADKLVGVFDMFSQVDRSMEKAQGGLGIGLTLVRRLVAMHEGEVEAKSEGPGRGSEFLVRLPLALDRPVAPSAPPTLAPDATLLRILIVDDNQDGADTLAAVLQLMGHEVHTAYDGQQGVDAADRIQPDVVLLDIGLPRLNGYEAARRIRLQGRRVLLVAVTGWGQEEDRRRSRDAGFDHHLVKPVDPEKLMRLLADLCGPSV
jgi:PAS domain S-box-containing protein